MGLLRSNPTFRTLMLAFTISSASVGCASFSLPVAYIYATPQLGADGLPDHDEHHRELVRDSSGRRPRRRLFAPPHPSDLRGRVGIELGGSLVDCGQRRLHRVVVGRGGADRRIRRFGRVRGRGRFDPRHRGHGRPGAGGAGPASPRLSGDDPGAGHGRRSARGTHHGALRRRRSGGMRLHPPARPAVARPPDGPPRTRARGADGAGRPCVLGWAPANTGT